MAKKKIKKETEKKEFQYARELQGLILILIGIIGFGDFGIVGDIVKKFAIFLMGNWYVIFLGICILVGGYLIVKRKSPEYFTARLIGFYTILIAVLLFSHMNYLENTGLKGIEIFRTTIDNVMVASENIDELRNTGGGMLGAFFSWMFVSLFDTEGTNIAVIVLSGFGLIMLFDITLSDVFRFFLKPFKKLREKNKEKKEKPLITIPNEEPEEENKVIITSMDELAPKIKYEEPVVKEQMSFDSTLPDPGEYMLPPIGLLDVPKKNKINSTEFITANTKVLERVFNDFGISGKVVQIHPGPTVTQYEVELSRGTKVNKILSIQKEIALNLAAKDIRIQAPIPGKNTVGIEVPNPIHIDVQIREILGGVPKKLESSKLLAPLGKDIMGNIQYVEINKTPHMLIAGSTGSGKSVCINNIIVSILMRTRPEEVKLVLVDPKKVELNVYENIPHLFTPVVTDPKKASATLQKLVHIMDDRYTMFNDTMTKNITTYNEYIEKYNSKNPDTKKERMPYILIIIDELADLMLVAAKEVEESITRITQLARAAGIHMIVATQRPSTDVITGLIKSNIPSRISFSVASSIDSRTILDMSGAEKLLGKGDMLFLPMGENSPIRIQGSFVSDDEIKRVVDFVKKSGKPKFEEKLSNENIAKSEELSHDDGEDSLYNEVVEFAIKTGKISTSLIQRKYRIGFNRAARIIDELEEKGIIGSQNGSKPRNVLVKLEEKEDDH